MSAVKDFTPFPYGADPESHDVRDWYDKLRNRLCIDYQNVITPASGDETYLYDVSANVTGKVTLATLLALQQNWLVDISGASGGQIKFPATQNPSSNANTLDDYEEGTWTPVFAGSGVPGAHAYAATQGYYTKIGRQVFIDYGVTVAAVDGSMSGTYCLVSGLPFAKNAGHTTYTAIPVALDGWAFIRFSVTGHLQAGFTAFYIFFTVTAGSGGFDKILAPADLTAGNNIAGSGSYHV